VIPASLTLGDPKRSAHAPLRGYLYQACLGVVRWLDLREDEALRCEGDEDLDLISIAGIVSEQVKAYSEGLGIADRAVVESLRQFLRSYVILRRRGETRSFLFTTTAFQRRSRKGGLDFDLLTDWQKGDRSEKTCGAVRTLLTTGENVPDWLAEPVAEVDAEQGGQGWPGFLDAVKWTFGEPGLDQLRDSILEKLNEFSALSAELFRDRLVAAVLTTSSQPKVADRVLTRKSLLKLADEARAELGEWAKSPAAVRLRKVFDELKEIGRLLLDNTDDLPPNPAPGKLLTASYEVIPFEEEGRRGELDDLEAWCNGPDPRSVLLLTGDGGSGKTRLALEWCSRLRHQGWHAGFLRWDRSEKDLDPLLEGVTPRLIVIDYAETHLAVVQPLLYKMGIDSHGGGPPVRLLLLARRAGDWWTGLRSGTAGRKIEDLLARSQPRPVTPLVPAAENRRQAFDAALAAFAEVTGKAVPAAPPVPNLEEKGFERVLYLHMAALAALDGRSIGSAAEALEETLRHERWFWSRQIEETRLRNAFDRAVAALTLVAGATTEPDARALLGRVLDGFPSRPDLMDGILDRLRAMYGGASRFVEPLQPDLLGEELVADVLQRDSRLLERLLDGATAEEGRALLTVLTRLAQRRPAAEEWLRAAFHARLDLLAESALEVAVKIGDPIGLGLAREIAENADESLAERLMDQCEEARYVLALPLREVALAATARKRDLFLQRHPMRAPQGIPESVAIEQARLASNLGKRLSDLGRREEALQATEEAVVVYRALAERRPSAFFPNLVKSLSNRGAMLSALGRREEALQSVKEVVKAYRKLAEQDPDTFLPGLAASLINFGKILSELGHREEALRSAKEAVKAYRKLAEQSPDAFLPDFTLSLNSLSNRLSALGFWTKALQAAEEAVNVCRVLAGRRPDSFLPNLAASLNNLGAILSALARPEEALQAIDEVVRVYRELARLRPNTFLPDLATGLHNFGNILSSLGRQQEALKATEEAVALRRKLAERQPDSFLPGIAASLNSLGVILSTLGRPEEAFQAAEEAVALRRKLAEQHPDAFLPDLATSLTKRLGNSITLR